MQAGSTMLTADVLDVHITHSTQVYIYSCGDVFIVRSSMYANYCSTNIRAGISCSSMVAYRILGSRLTQA
jgi:hypothetical protein